MRETISAERLEALEPGDIVRFMEGGRTYIRRVESVDISNEVVFIFDEDNSDPISAEDIENHILYPGEVVYIYRRRALARVTAVAENSGIFSFRFIDREGEDTERIESYDGYLTFKIVSEDEISNDKSVSPSEEETKADPIVQQIASVLKEASYPFNVINVKKMADEWREKKAGLIEVLRRHPKWDEENFCIETEVDEVREQEDNAFLAACKEFYGHCYNAGKYFTDAELDVFWDGVECTSPSPYVSETIAERYKAVGVEMKVGAKYSRELQKIFISMGLDKYDFYNKDFAKISDAINPMQNKQRAVLSMHPCDFLKMSWGEKWNSCHDIRNNGCYHAGTQSYMMDDVSLIFYTVSNSGDKIPWKNNKLTRQIWAYKDGFLLESRCYPKYQMKSRNDEYARCIRKVFSECGVSTEGWDEIFKNSIITSRVKTAEGATHYPDYAYEEYQCRLFMNPAVKDGDTLVVGSRSLDLLSGKRHSIHERINLENSNNSYGRMNYDQDPYYICYESDNVFHQGDGRSYDGYDRDNNRWYTDGYYRVCDICGAVEFGEYDEGEWFGDMYYCSSCAEDRLRICDRCGEKFDIREEGGEDDHGVYCDYCLENAVKCEECGNYIFDGDEILVGDAYYCEDCVEELFVLCEDCEGYVSRDSAIEVEDGYVCPECFEARKEDTAGVELENTENMYRVIDPNYLIMSPQSLYERGFEPCKALTSPVGLQDVRCKAEGIYTIGNYTNFIMRMDDGRWFAIRSKGVQRL